MKKSNTKTSLSVVLQHEGGANVDLKWSDIDSDHIKASERVMLEIVTIPEYGWLREFVAKHLTGRYCDKCIDRLNMRAKCRDESDIDRKPFPYCFISKEENINGTYC